MAQSIGAKNQCKRAHKTEHKSFVLSVSGQTSKQHAIDNRLAMAKHTTTHLFFHMNDHSGSSSKLNQFGGTGQRKPKRTNTTFNHELNSSNSFDYYEYFSNYGRLMGTPPLSPSHSMPRESLREREYRYGFPF